MFNAVPTSATRCDAGRVAAHLTDGGPADGAASARRALRPPDGVQRPRARRARPRRDGGRWRPLAAALCNAGEAGEEQALRGAAGEDGGRRAIRAPRDRRSALLLAVGSRLPTRLGGDPPPPPGTHLSAPEPN